MILVVAFLIAALVATNFFWGRYCDAIQKDAHKRQERLLDRIQAPELAAVPEIEVKQSHVGFDDDLGYWAAKEEVEAA